MQGSLFSSSDFDNESPSPLSVFELTTYIRDMLEDDTLLRDVWIEGEISNLRQAPSGHLYLSLKDEKSQLKVVMWKSQASRLSFIPDHGTRVLAHGKITVYEPRGEYQLVADTLQPVGLGDLHQQFERLKAKLLAEGLFDAELKKPLPLFPKKIGVVTSPSTAAFQDVLNVLRRRFPIAEVILSPTLVQGEAAPIQIMTALERLYQYPDIDVILLVRGGGSLEDLWCFNDEGVTRLVAASPIPLITGVGHEIDFTLVDFASDHRAPTPSAAAEVATPELAGLQYAVQLLQERAYTTMDTHLNTFSQELALQIRTLGHLSPQRQITNFQQRTDELSLRLERGMENRLTNIRQRLITKQAALQASNPNAILARGYAIIRRAGDGKQISDSIEADSGTLLNIQLHRGSLRATVKDRSLSDD